MAQVNSRFITEDDYILHRHKQDEDIRKEFQTQRSLIEIGNNELQDGISTLQHEFNDKLCTVNDTLSGRLGELNNELGRVKEDLRDLKKEVGQVKEEVGQVKEEVGQVKEEVGQVKEEVGQVKEKVGEIEARLNWMEGQRHNGSRKLPYHDIASIGVYRPNIGFKTPQYFPRSVKEFWSLQFPRNEKKLLYLVRFYDIQGFEYWGRPLYPTSASDSNDESSDESDSLSDPSQQHLSIEDAVRKYPGIAIDELASRLGLVFQDIREFFQRAAQHRQRPPLEVSKRGLAEAKTTEVKDTKRARRSEPQSSPRDVVPLEFPVSFRPAKSVSEEPDVLLWDASSNERHYTKVIAKMQAYQPGGTPSRGSSKDSLTEAMLSQEMREALGGRKEGSRKG
ncbi:hypothetical protein G7Y89_g3628 [Cudoniella acicularis]|uniref:Uncharacterized protein n=1 Tax=Cudoniella acicularis TaxID=354080 RepID=A0A8H4RRU4_9HELO|nr:hypothetical protein G7Y89_g3628 [Cudoniella acicularis]